MVLDKWNGEIWFTSDSIQSLRPSSTENGLGDNKRNKELYPN